MAHSPLPYKLLCDRGLLVSAEQRRFVDFGLLLEHISFSAGDNCVKFYDLGLPGVEETQFFGSICRFVNGQASLHPAGGAQCRA